MDHIKLKVFAKQNKSATKQKESPPNGTTYMIIFINIDMIIVIKIACCGLEIVLLTLATKYNSKN